MPLRSTNPPRVVGKFIEPGIMDATTPPIVDSAQPEKEEATSPNDVRPPVPDRTGRLGSLLLSAREACVRLAQIGQ